MKIKILFLFLLFLTISIPGFASETIDVNLFKGKISATKLTLNHDDSLNICSRDSDFHQPYSVSPQNKFGSPKAKERDMLKKEQCRIVRVKNTSKALRELVLYDRFHPHASLAFKVNPKVAGQPLLGKSTEFSFPKPALENIRLDWCYSRGEGCGEKAAYAFCQLKGYTKAKFYDTEEASSYRRATTRYIGNNQLCRSAGCVPFKNIVCQKEPTFF